MRFKDKVALITAAANGIGRATARSWRAKVPSSLRSTIIRNGWTRRSTPDQAGGQAHGTAVRCARSVAGRRRRGGGGEEFGRIDILVNAVGGSTIIPKPAAKVDEHSLDDWQRLINFNLNGTFLFLHAVVPVMKQQKTGKIVNLASIAGRGLSRRQRECLRRGEGRDHRVHPQTVLRTGGVQHQRQRHRTQPHADRAHPAALEPALARGAGG